MSSKKRTYVAPYYIQKIDLGNNNRKPRRNSPKLCPDCKETNDCTKLFSSHVNKVEGIIHGFFKNLPKEEPYLFNVKFAMNNVPCELECDLSKFTFENLQKLVIFTTQNCNNSSNKNDKNDKINVEGEKEKEK